MVRSSRNGLTVAVTWPTGLSKRAGDSSHASSSSTRVSVTSPPRTKSPLPSSTFCGPGNVCSAFATLAAAPGVCATSSGVSDAVRPDPSVYSPAATTVIAASDGGMGTSVRRRAVSQGISISTVAGTKPTRRATRVATPRCIVRSAKRPRLSVVVCSCVSRSEIVVGGAAFPLASCTCPRTSDPAASCPLAVTRGQRQATSSNGATTTRGSNTGRRPSTRDGECDMCGSIRARIPQ